MAGRGHPARAWEEARNAVILEGLTYAEAAARSGIDVSSIQKRAARDRWQDARKKRADRLVEYRGKLELLRDKLLDRALETGDPQAVHAFNQIEKTVPGRSLQLSEGERLRIATETATAFVDVLSDVDPDLAVRVAAHLDTVVEQVVAAEWS